MPPSMTDRAIMALIEKEVAEAEDKLFKKILSALMSKDPTLGRLGPAEYLRIYHNPAQSERRKYGKMFF